jgi:Family of unknown function (DUF6496)
VLPAAVHRAHEWLRPVGFPQRPIRQEDLMAKKRKRKYSPGVGQDVEREMRRYKRGTARSGPGGKAGKVKSRKQAIAIALSEARKEGKRVPKKK